METIDKRKRARVDFDMKVVFESSGCVYQECQCENISMSGLFLRTDMLLPVGAEGKLLIILECGTERLEVHSECKVSRIADGKDGQPMGMGLEYITLDSDSSLTLYNVIKYQGGIEMPLEDL